MHSAHEAPRRWRGAAACGAGSLESEKTPDAARAGAALPGASVRARPALAGTRHHRAPFPGAALAIAGLVACTLLAAAPLAAQQGGGEDAAPPAPGAGDVAAIAAAEAREAAAAVAGYDRGFYIRDGNGRGELRIGFLSQVRAIQSRLPGEGAADDGETVGGYQLRRFQINLQGYFLSPRWTYRFRLDASNGGGVAASYAWVGYQASPSLDIRVGQTKPSFLREEDVGSNSQLAIERSYTADYFTTDFAQGVQASWRRNRLRLSAMLHNGSYGFRTDLDNESSTVALAGRAEYLLLAPPSAGWARYNDFSSWSGGPTIVVLGAAADYENGRNDAGVHRPSITKWTADLTVKTGPVALFGAVIGQRFDTAPGAQGLPPGLDDARQFGAVAQAGLFVVPDRFELFGRYETIDFDGVYLRLNQGSLQGGSGPVSQDRFNAITVGGTYYFAGQNARLTVDAVAALDPVPVSNTGQGLLRSTGDGSQVALRTQLQFGF